MKHVCDDDAVTVCSAAGGSIQHRRENVEEGGCLCRESADHDGHHRRVSRTERAQVQVDFMIICCFHLCAFSSVF